MFAAAETRLLLVGFPGEVHLGAHFLHSARQLGIAAELLDFNQAWSTNLWRMRLGYHLCGRTPNHLRAFSQKVLESAQRFRPTVLLASGFASIDCEALRIIRRSGTIACNFLADDPFNPVLRAKWFLRALPEYDILFSPRQANLEDLRAAGGREVRYLPFAYNPEIHYAQSPADDSEHKKLASDVFFAGAADPDRVGSMARIIQEGYRVALYGGFWNRHRVTRTMERGIADAETVRKACATAKVCICLVRRSNRDGHCMRSYELPAMHCCILAEDTEEHREIYGPPGEAVVYFQSCEEMMEKLKILMVDEETRNRLANHCKERICKGKNTYTDRLIAILNAARTIPGKL